ncbi:MAG: CARDB domain-containing protein, partial [Planctomycetaceae bacterium]
DFAKASLKVGLGFGMIATILQMISGDISAKGVVKNQPVKLAAMEGLYDTETQAPRATASKAPTAAELSSIKSSRRSDRRAIDALTVEATIPTPQADVEPEMPAEPVALTERLPIPSVPRRELTVPAETDTPRPSAASDRVASDVTTQRRETIPQLPKLPPSAGEVADSDIPPLLPAEKSKTSTDALVDSWQSVGSGVSRAPVSKPADADGPKSTIPKQVDPIATESTSSQASAAPEKTLRDQLVQESAAASQDSSNSTAGASAKATNQAVTRKAESTSKSLAASELPGVRVVTEGPSEIMIRELTQYEIRVENRGSFDATGIVVQSSLPAWAQVQGHNASLGTIKTIDQSGQPQLQWTIDKLPAGVVERLFVRVKAVKSGVFDVATDWTMLPQKHVAKITVREPKLLVTIDGPEEIIYGRSEKYRVRVMNPGDGDAANVVFTLSPESKVPQSQTIGSIPAGKEAQFEIELTARELGELKIGGVAVADRDVKTTANKSIRVAAANVEAELTGPPLKYQNAEATYHLTVTNTGKANCEAIEADLRLPAGVKYVSGVQQASMQGDRLTWKIDALQPGAVREYDIVCKLDRTGEMVLAFNCSGSAAGRASVSIETQVEAIADLALSVSDPVAPAPVDAEVTYEITILNRGSKAAEAVRVVAQFGPGIEPIRVEGHTGEVVTGQALFNPISRIEPGSSLRLKVVAKADRAGDHRFRAEVRHGETSLVSEEATMFMNMPAERISRRSTAR